MEIFAGSLFLILGSDNLGVSSTILGLSVRRVGMGEFKSKSKLSRSKKSGESMLKTKSLLALFPELSSGLPSRESISVPWSFGMKGFETSGSFGKSRLSISCSSSSRCKLGWGLIESEILASSCEGSILTWKKIKN